MANGTLFVPSATSFATFAAWFVASATLFAESGTLFILFATSFVPFATYFIASAALFVAKGVWFVAAENGSATQDGLFVNVTWVSFNQLADGPAALAAWLCDQGCIGIKYDFQAGMGMFGDDGAD